jgi:acyl-CoA thioesterase FadM
MTHCLFARGVQGVTAKLQIRFEAPVRIRTPAVVEAAPVQGANSLRKLRATITQAGRVCATAEATFVSMHRSPPGGERAGE